MIKKTVAKNQAQTQPTMAELMAIIQGMQAATAKAETSAKAEKPKAPAKKQAKAAKSEIVHKASGKAYVDIPNDSVVCGVLEGVGKVEVFRSYGKTFITVA